MNEIIDIDEMIKVNLLSAENQAIYKSIKSIILLNKNLLVHENDTVQLYLKGLIECIKTNEDRIKIYEECSIPEYKLYIVTQDLLRTIKLIDDALDIAVSCDNEEKMEWINYGSNLIQQMNYNLNLYNSLTTKKEEKEPSKKIIFLDTGGGNYYFERDLKKIPQEKYDLYAQMLKDMHDGVFTSNTAYDKSLSFNNAIYKGCWEKKLYGVRIQYFKMPNDVLLIAMMEMKDDSLVTLRERLTNNKEKINNIRKIISLNDEQALSLIREGEDTYQKLINYLENEARIMHTK